MRIVEWNDFLKHGLPVDAGRTAMTIGVFDGMHRGHKTLIERIIHNEYNFLPVIITFRHNLKNTGNISSFRQRIDFFDSLGAAVAIVADLTESFRSMSGAEFLCILREQCKMGLLAVGSNFKCGHNQDTNALKIREINAGFNIPTEIVEVLTEDGLPIGSSRIRAAVINGEIKLAQSMLGHPFTLDIRNAAIQKNDAELFLRIIIPENVMPPRGKYTALLHCAGSGRKEKTEIQIRENVIEIPLNRECGFCECDFIEFMDPVI